MRIPKYLAAALVAVFASGAIVAPAAAGPAPAPGAGLYSFTYYPERGIYYDARRGIWYWNDGKSWNSGTELPSEYRQYTAGGVRVDLESQTPYEHQARVEARHGKPRGYESSREANAVKKESAKKP